MPPAGDCPDWTHTAGMYYEACDADNVGTFENLTAAEAKTACCASTKCAGFSFSNGGVRGSGYYKGDAKCGLTKNSGYDGYTKTSQIPGPPPSKPVDITVKYADITGFGVGTSVDVLDIWSGARTTGTVGSYTAKAVPLHGSAFLVLEEKASLVES
eukprot:6355001-Prymnesium_polylepis.1